MFCFILHVTMDLGNYIFVFDRFEANETGFNLVYFKSTSRAVDSSKCLRMTRLMVVQSEGHTACKNPTTAFCRMSLLRSGLMWSNSRKIGHGQLNKPKVIAEGGVEKVFENDCLTFANISYQCYAHASVECLCFASTPST